MKAKATKPSRPMLSEQQFVEKWRKLTPTKQQQVIDFVEHLESESSGSDESRDRVLPTIEIWSPYDSHTAAQDLLKLLETDPGEDCA